jgi:hypothetical protein
MFCGSCGKQVPEGSGFCPSCGAAAGASGQPGATASSTGAGPTAAAAQRAKIEAQLKASSQDAVAAVKVLLTDPVGGLAKSFAMFDSARAQIVGAIFGAVFAIATTIAASLMTSMIMGVMATAMGGGMGMLGAGASPFGTPGIPASVYVRIFILYVIEFVGLGVGCLVTRMIFKGAGNLASDIYIAGSCLLPMGIGVLAGALLGNVIWWLLFIPILFGGCYMILMLYAGGMNIGKISEGKAALSVPIALSVMFAVVYVGMKIML